MRLARMAASSSAGMRFSSRARPLMTAAAPVAASAHRSAPQLTPPDACHCNRGKAATAPRRTARDSGPRARRHGRRPCTARAAHRAAGTRDQRPTGSRSVCDSQPCVRQARRAACRRGARRRPARCGRGRTRRSHCCDFGRFRHRHAADHDALHAEAEHSPRHARACGRRRRPGWRMSRTLAARPAMSARLPWRPSRAPSRSTTCSVARAQLAVACEDRARIVAVDGLGVEVVPAAGARSWPPRRSMAGISCMSGQLRRKLCEQALRPRGTSARDGTARRGNCA